MGIFAIKTFISSDHFHPFFNSFVFIFNFSLWLIKNLDFPIWNYPYRQNFFLPSLIFLLNLTFLEFINWENLIAHLFTMVEENFEFWLAEIPQIDRNLLFNSSPWLKKFLKFGHLKLPMLTASFFPEFIFFWIWPP